MQVIIWIFVPHIHIQSMKANQSKNTSRNKEIVQKNTSLLKDLIKKHKSYTSQLETYLFKSGSREEICTKQQKVLLQFCMKSSVMCFSFFS